MTPMLRSWTRPIVARPLVALGAAFLLTIVAFAAFAPWIAPFGPDAIDPVNRLLPPDSAPTSWEPTISAATRSAASSSARGWRC